MNVPGRLLLFCSRVAILAGIAVASIPNISAAPLQTSGEQATSVSATDPVADPRAIVVDGHARFTVLTPQMIRMEWAADGKFEDHASFVFLNRHLPVPSYQHSKRGDTLTIKTEALTLTYKGGRTAANGKFTAANLAISFSLNGKEVTWHPGQQDTGNLLGTTRTLDGALGDKTREPIGEGLISRDGWVVVDDSTRPLFDSHDFSFSQGEQSEWPWVVLRPAGDRQDWYFFGYGHEYKQALHDYVTVAGRIPLPPRFAFGAWWSRYWAYSDQELDDLVRGFHENDVPLDVLVIDMDWHKNEVQLQAAGEKDQSGHSLGWSGYSWNKMLFPYPAEFLKRMRDQGLKATLNLHPASGVEPWEDAYPAMARAMGIDPASHKYVPFDITNKNFATNYMNLLHHPLEQQGINFWWLDWQQEANTSTPGVSPTWWLNYVHFTDQEREGKRPLLFHRWGGLGNHRYQIGFSGDTVSVWQSLAFQPWFTATAANVGYAYWSHDIGGHMPGAVDPELYTRWIQFGAFSPILRTHTTKNPDSERRIWAYPEPYSQIMRDTFHLRYALEPYIYTEGRRTYDTGLAFLRPLYYDWPEAPEAYTSKGEYRFGEQMLVAPVVAPVDKDSLLAKESIWIPKGDWIEWDTGKRFSGPASVERSFSIDQIPVYVKAGGIVPMQPPMRYTGEKPVDPLIINVMPLADGQASTYTLYEDASRSEAYQHGVCAWTDLSAKQSGPDLDVEIAAVRGQYPGMPDARGYEIRLPGNWPPASVTVNGQPLGFEPAAGKPGWRFEGNTLTTIITVPRTPVAERVQVRVHVAPELAARRADLDGFAGEMTRLRAAYDALNQAWPIAWPPDVLIDAMQTGDRLSYHPETAEKEIAHLRELAPKLLPAAEAIAQGAPAKIDEAERRYEIDPNSDAGKAKAAEYNARLNRAIAQIHDSGSDMSPR
jgi:alpha-glucosidase (family GH31 glycosyl hydrolase)